MAFTIPSQAPTFAPYTIVYPKMDSDTYEGRIVRVVSLGMHPKTKLIPQGNSWIPSPNPADTQDCFKMTFQIEIIGLNAAGVKWELIDEKWEEVETYQERPVSVFHDVWVYPNATRGNFFDMLKAVDPDLTKVPSDLEYYGDTLLGAPINVMIKVNPDKKYTEADRKAGKPRRYFNNVKAITGMSNRMKQSLPEAVSPLLFFNCFDGSEKMEAVYAELPKFQRELLAEASDAASIPFAGTEPKEYVDPNTAQEPSKVGTPSTSAGGMDFDDDIPF